MLPMLILRRQKHLCFGGKTFAISAEDVKSVTNTLTALHNCKEEDDEDPLEGILENIPRELKPLLGAAIMVSKLRKGGNN